MNSRARPLGPFRAASAVLLGVVTVAFGSYQAALAQQTPISREDLRAVFAVRLGDDRIASTLRARCLTFDLTQPFIRELESLLPDGDFPLSRVALRNLARCPPPPQAAVGVINVTTSPPGAEVFIDGTSRGRTSAEGVLEVRKLPLGKRVVAAKLQGFDGDEREVTLTQQRKSETVHLELTPIRFSVSFSMPPEAKADVIAPADCEKRGAAYWCPPGLKEFRFRCPFCAEKKQNVFFSLDTQGTIDIELELAPESVDSVVRGALDRLSANAEDLDAAEREVVPVLSVDPNNPGARGVRASIELLRGQTEAFMADASAAHRGGGAVKLLLQRESGRAGSLWSQKFRDPPRWGSPVIVLLTSSSLECVDDLASPGALTSAASAVADSKMMGSPSALPLDALEEVAWSKDGTWIELVFRDQKKPFALTDRSYYLMPDRTLRYWDVAPTLPEDGRRRLEAVKQLLESTIGSASPP